MADKTFTIENYLPSPDKPGFVRFSGNKTFEQVGKAIEAELKRRNLNRWEWLNFDDNKHPVNTPIPKYSRLIVGVMSGRNEGEITQLLALTKDGSFPIVTIKHFEGWEYGFQLAAAIREFLADNI